MRTIDITRILSSDLKSRARANDLKLFIENCGDNEVLIDFQNVKFSTRSFMDEFYNLFVKKSSDRNYVVSLTNVPEDIKIMLDSVSRTLFRKPRLQIIRGLSLQRSQQFPEGLQAGRTGP